MKALVRCSRLPEPVNDFRPEYCPGTTMMLEADQEHFLTFSHFKMTEILTLLSPLPETQFADQENYSSRDRSEAETRQKLSVLVLTHTRLFGGETCETHHEFKACLRSLA